MSEYVVSYRCIDGVYLEVMTMEKLAELVGFSDFNECVDFTVWRVVDSQMQKLTVHHMHKESTVYLTDKFDNWVDSQVYEAH